MPSISQLGTDVHYGYYEDFMVVLELALPLLVKFGLATQAEAEELYCQAIAEMMMDELLSTLL